MFRRVVGVMGVAGAMFALMAADPVSVRAEDFFSHLFGFARPFGSPRPFGAMPYAEAGPDQTALQPRRTAPVHSLQAFCVRTCDGRYFPLPSGAGESRAETCNNFCPATETKVFFGRNIDHASGANGESYSKMPNAFRYRSEIVPGCTCNGRTPFGLAHIGIEQDKTIRRGDLIASDNGLMVAKPQNERRGAKLTFSPAPDSVRVGLERVPVLASN